MKKNLNYIMISILSLVVGILGTYIYINKNDTIIVKETEKVVSVTESDTIKSAVSKIYDATILVESYNSKNVKMSTGTGFIYKKDDKYGYIITNNHVIEDSKTIKILDNYGTRIDGTLLGSDVFSDIAVIRIDKDSVLQVAEIGSSENSSIGDTMFTVGSPLGAEYVGTVTKGILSGKNRLVSVTLSNGDYLIEALQTDAAINPGNSGGPLVNMNGEVIGVNSLKLVEDEIEGMGFAIPIETVMSIIDKLEANEQIARPYLGVQLIDTSNTYQLYYNRITLDENVEYGAVLAYIEDDKPASKAGLKKGDVIIEINGNKIEDTQTFRYILYKCEVGESIKVKYYRDNNIKETSIELTEKIE